MKKIFFLIGNLDRSGGTERVTSLIANELVEQDYNISILSLNGGSEPFFELNTNVQIHSLYPENVSFKKNFIGAIWKIRQFIKYNEVDTLIVVDTISCLFTIPALYGLRTKHICWEHFNFNNNNGVKSRDLARKLAANYCDYVVTLTKRDKELWQKYLKNIKSKIISISNPNPYENVEYNARLNHKKVLAVGRLTSVKGFDLLIDAWAQVCDANNDWTLCIVGSGEEEEKLKEQAQLLNIFERCNFIPATKDVEQYYKTSSIYCLSSRFEGFPMVLLEAQAFGLPIGAFNCDTGPAEIVVDGVNGLLVKVGEAEQLASCLSSIIDISDEKYGIMSSNAIESSQRFSVKEITKLWVSII